jgi:hypothetical protein
LTSASIVAAGVAPAGKLSANTVAEPLSRLTATATLSSGATAIADPRLAPGKTGPAIVISPDGGGGDFELLEHAKKTRTTAPKYRCI